MRSLPYARLLGGVVLAGGLAVALALPASARGPHVTPLGQSAKTATHRVLSPSDSDCVQYDQSADLTGVAIVSQNFGSPFDDYDSQGVDDFRIKSNCKGQSGLLGTKPILVSNVVALGVYFNGSGPADSYNVTFYKDKHGAPGSVLKECDNQPYADGGFGSPQIDLAKKDNPKATCVKKDVKLQPGKTYWVSVQANMDFSSGGEWGWDTVLTTSGHEAMWQNPGDGLGTGCTSYTTLTTCFGSGQGVDFAFQILR